MKTITISIDGRANYHNQSDMRVRVPDDAIGDSEPMEIGGREYVQVRISASQMTRIRRHYCGMSDCCCGSGPRMESRSYDPKDGGWLYVQDEQIND